MGESAIRQLGQEGVFANGSVVRKNSRPAGWQMVETFRARSAGLW